MLTAQDRSICTEQYHDKLPTIITAVDTFRRRYGGNWDEIMADANLVFVENWSAMFADVVDDGLLAIIMIRRLLEIRRREIGRSQTKDFRVESWPYLNPIDDFGRSPVDAAELSDDAETVLQLVESDSIAADAVKHGGHRQNWRGAIRRELRKMKWSAVRINESFSEMTKAIMG